MAAAQPPGSPLTSFLNFEISEAREAFPKLQNTNLNLCCCTPAGHILLAQVQESGSLSKDPPMRVQLRSYLSSRTSSVFSHGREWPHSAAALRIHLVCGRLPGPILTTYP